MPKKTRSSVTTMREAARALCEPLEYIRAACHEGGARSAGGRIHLDRAELWIRENRGQLEKLTARNRLRNEKLSEEVRKLKLRNNREESQLVELSWVAERFQRFAGDVGAIRDRSVERDAGRFVEAGGNIPKCRSVLRGIWDQIMRDMQACSKHFEQ